MDAEALAFDEFLERIANDPIAGAAEAQDRHEGVRKARWESAAAGFALAQALKKKNRVDEFYRLPFWQGANTRDPEKLLLHALQFTYGDRKGEEGACAQDHASALQPFLEKLTAKGMLRLLVITNSISGLKAAAKGTVTKKNQVAALLVANSLKKIRKMGGIKVLIKSADKLEVDDELDASRLPDSGALDDDDLADGHKKKRSKGEETPPPTSRSDTSLQQIPHSALLKKVWLDADPDFLDELLNLTENGKLRGTFEFERLSDSARYSSVAGGAPLKRIRIAKV